MLRRYTFKLYPNAAQEAALRHQARLCAILWNALLEMRETFYRRAKQRGDKKTSLTAYDQGKDLTKLNQAAKSDPDLAEWNLLSSKIKERVAGDLDNAFKAFFRRAKAGAGAQSGYPRFKSVRHADAIPLREANAGGWKFTAHSAPAGNSEPCRIDGRQEASRARGEEGFEPPKGSKQIEASRARGEEGGGNSANWRFTLRGVPGCIKARGKFPVTPDGLKTADVKFHAGAWWLSVCVEIAARATHGDETLKVEFDLIDSFAFVKDANGRCAPGLSDPFSDGRKGEFANRAEALPKGPCGEPHSGGEVQGIGSEISSRQPCGEPHSGGEVQGATRRDGRSCGEPHSGSVAQVSRVDAIQAERDRRFKRGSIRWRREKDRIAKIKAREARQRREALHRWSTAIVRMAADITIIAPPVSDMRTGRGAEQKHGAQVETIAMLNRSVRSKAPASAIQMLEYKAAEAAIRCDVVKAPEHQIQIGGELRAAAIAARKARRIAKREERKAS